MDQQRLIKGEPEAAYVQATFVVGSGWQLTLGVRHQFQLWADHDRERYEYLTTAEMADVIASALLGRLLRMDEP